MEQARGNRAVKWLKVLGRVVMVVALASSAGWLLNRSIERVERRQEQAGFARGMLHGAMMPCAMPNLIAGRDVTIYAPNNTGRTYKLGYTVGVNACGALFFGLFFWRVNRWRRRLQNARPATGVVTAESRPA